MIILVSEVRHGLCDDVFLRISDCLLQGVVGAYLGTRWLYAAVLHYPVEGGLVVVSY